MQIMFGLVLIINVGATGLVARSNVTSNATSNKHSTNIRQAFEKRSNMHRPAIVLCIGVGGETILIGSGEQTARPYILGD